MAREFPEPKYAVEGVLPEGVTVFAGRPKLGKSWCGLGIAVAVACGGYALGKIPVERGDVLYLALEDGERRLQIRLRKMLAGGSVPSNLDFATEWRKLDAGGLDDLEDWIKSHPEARLVVIDTLKRVRPAERRMGRLYDGDYDAIAPLGDVARKYGVAVVVIHHTRKVEGDDPLDLVSGTTGLTGAADGVMVLKRSRGQMDAELHATGRDFEDKQLALRWDETTCQWNTVGSVEEFQLTRERREVVDLLKKVGGMTPKDVAEALNKKRGTVRKLLCDMSSDGQIRKDETGRYVATKKSSNGGNTLFNGDEESVTDVTAVTVDCEAIGEAFGF
jgi:RecA-family ATPase